MSAIVIPFIMLDDSGAVLLHNKNRAADKTMFDTVGWDPLDTIPRNGLANAGLCRCGKGILAFYWPAMDSLNLAAQTKLRCTDHCGPGCKSDLTIEGVVRTYGGLLLELEEQNIEQQSELIEVLERDYWDRIANKENELKEKFTRQLQQV
jgi:hypothetical protein